MAFATLTFPTTILAFLPILPFLYSKKENSGFHRFYGDLSNGEVLSIHRSFFMPISISFQIILYNI